MDEDYNLLPEVVAESRDADADDDCGADKIETGVSEEGGRCE